MSGTFRFRNRKQDQVSRSARRADRRRRWAYARAWLQEEMFGDQDRRSGKLSRPPVDAPAGSGVLSPWRPARRADRTRPGRREAALAELFREVLSSIPGLGN